ncbi:hypothetical protein BGZ57DRAFT_304040 [Hyaloscypha finlandica]|nr:hypothetical protein BGZ57DRAFT_304040 [Hyaloscypha finlandica]
MVHTGLLLTVHVFMVSLSSSKLLYSCYKLFLFICSTKQRSCHKRTKNRREFSIKDWLIYIKAELARGTMRTIERSTSENQIGKFRYDPVMAERERRYRQASGQQRISWEYDVENGLDPLHGA